MSGITKMVDDQIKAIRQERSELEALKEDLERRAAVLSEQETSFEGGDLSYLNEKNAALKREIEDAQNELERLRDERNRSLTSFGDEIDQIHSERAQDNRTLINQLNKDIDDLNNRKAGLELQIEALGEEIQNLQKQKDEDFNNILEEKEQYLSRQRAEREESLKDLKHEHSMEVSAMELKRKDLENELEAISQRKELEWEQVQAEIARYRATQKAEMEALKERMLAETESECAEILSAAKDVKDRRMAEFAEMEKARERDINDLELKKQAVIDETDLLQYEFEKNKAENVVKFEKTRSEEIKRVEELRAEALMKLEFDKKTVLEELEVRKSGYAARMQEDRTAFEQEIAELERRKGVLQSELGLIHSRFDTSRAESDAQLETLKHDKLREIDEMRLARLQEVEEMRQARLADLERVYFARIESLESARGEKLEAAHMAIETAEQELNKLKHSRHEITQEIEELLAESNRLRAENEAISKIAAIDRQAELEKITTEKLTEIEAVCEKKLEAVQIAEDRAGERIRTQETSSKDRLRTINEEIAKLERQRDNLNSELSLQLSRMMEEVEGRKIEELDGLSQMKLAKLKEVERDLEEYREEKMRQINAEAERQIEGNYRRIEELAALNEEYNRRAAELDERALLLESEKRSLQLKEQLINEEQMDYKNLIESEKQFHRKEMALLIETKDHQMTLIEDRLNVQTDLEQENKRLTMKVSSLEQERHNWQIAVNEINRLTEEKAILEEQLSRGRREA